MKLWGRTTSINVQKALWALDELGLLYEQVNAGGPYGGLDTAEFLAMNPNGLVPVLQDGELVVWESNVIVRYVAARYGEGTLWPRDPAKRAIADQWMEWGNTTILPLMTTCFFNAVRYRPEKRDRAALEQAAEKLGRHFGTMDRYLASYQAPFVTGDRLTIADISFGAHLYRYYEMPLPRPALPALADYYDRLRKREAYRHQVMVSFESMAGTL